MTQLLITMWLLICLAVISYIDLRQQIIPDICLLLMLPAAFFPAAAPRLYAETSGAAATGSISVFGLPSRSHFFAAAVPVALYILMAVVAAAFSRDAPIGMGDAKLLAVIGLISGPAALLFTATAASLACGFTAAILLLTKKVTKKSRFAFGPFLAVAYIIHLFI